MYYKVIRRINNELRSCWVYNSVASVKYIPNEWVYPVIDNPLMAFNDFKSACLFASNFYTAEIWECDVVLTSKDALFCPSDYMFLIRFIENPTEDNLNYLSKQYSKFFINEKPPKDTVFCDAIKLFKKKVTFHAS